MPDKRDQTLLTSDLDDEIFGIKEGVDDAPDVITLHPSVFSIPRYKLEGNIDDYENQSGRQEVVWSGGSISEPDCIWLVNSDNSYTKWKSADTGSGTFCEEVISCVSADFEKGNGSADRYNIPEMDGPVWQVENVESGEPLSDIDFSSDGGSDLATLIVALNNSVNLPADWIWEVYTSALSLLVPHGTIIGEITLAGGEIVTFPDGPSIVGSNGSTLAESSGGSGIQNPEESDDSQDDIEARFSAENFATVRWVDSDGDQRISYKDPVNGWHHPRTKEFATDFGATSYKVFEEGYANSDSKIDQTEVFLLSDTDKIPNDATEVLFHYSVDVTTDNSSYKFSISANDIIRFAHEDEDTTGTVETFAQEGTFWSKVDKSTNTVTIEGKLDDGGNTFYANRHNITIYAVGYRVQ